MITISKHTTRITQPLDRQGFADYTAYLNQTNSEGVTSENNAVILYWKAIGPNSEETSPEFMAKLVEVLGVDVFAEPGPHLVNIDQFAQQKVKAGIVDDNQVVDDQQEKTTEGPWTADQYPLMAEWVRMNEIALRLVIEGSKRERYYSPVVTVNEGDPLMETLLPNVYLYRSFARLLQARAMLALGEGRAEDALQDLLTMHRLARHTSQGPTLIEMLVGIAIDVMATSGDHRLALHGNLTSNELVAWRKQLSQLGPSSNFRRVIDEGERFISLDTVKCYVRATMLDDQEKVQHITSLGFEDLSFLSTMVMRFSIDWDAVMTIFNARYDALVLAASLPSREQRIVAFERLQNQLEAQPKEVDSHDNFAKFSLLSKETRGQKLGNILAGIHIPMLLHAQEAEDRCNSKLAALQTGLAIVAYQTDHGQLPSKLSDLVPKYIEAVPNDPYTDAPLTYKICGSEFAVYSWGRNLKDNNGRTWGDEGANYDNHDHVFRSEGWVVK